jgi:hypothetical protein
VKASVARLAGKLLQNGQEAAKSGHESIWDTLFKRGLAFGLAKQFAIIPVYIVRMARKEQRLAETR